MDVRAWLAGLGLQRYETAFREHQIDAAALPRLSDADLVKVGVPLADREKLLNAVRVLNSRPPDSVLGGRDEPYEKPGEAHLAAQRRQLTVLFCDLVGSTELSTQLDPEDMREIIGAYHHCCTEIIEKTGGFLAQYMGDGVLAYFGYPRAHEDDAERAIHAALMITQAAPALRTPQGASLAVRIGIATGLVVVGHKIGAGSAEQRAVVGETPNFASRLQTLAGPNQVVVSDTTRRLAAGLFEYRDLGAVSLKGLTGHGAVWQAVGINSKVDRFRARHEAGPAPMVGREEHLEFILGRWRSRARGVGQTIGVVGDAGIGKSRLIYETRRRIAREPHVWIEGGGAPVFTNTPFYAVRRMIANMLARQRQTKAAGDSGALERALGAAGVDVDAALPLIAGLIGIPTPVRGDTATMSAEQRRNDLISALADWLLKSAERWPTVLAIEDLQWVDPSSLELFTRLVENGPSAGLFVLYTTRGMSAAPWPLNERHTQIVLERMPVDSMRRLVAASSTVELPPELIDEVIARADGVPLFAEELTRLMAVRAGAGREREIPGTLSDLLMERLDQLGPAKHIAQTASLLGRGIPLRLIRSVSGVGDLELETSLARLIDEEILVHDGAPSDHTFSFRQSLVQDAAYGALLKSQRRELHRRAAEVIGDEFPDMAMTQPEVLAQHWAAADEPELALSAWREAGHSARARKAFKEAQAAYGKALAILETLAQSPERAARELALQSSLAGVLQITRGYSAPETMAATARARALAQEGGDLSQQLRQANGQWAALSSAGEFLAASRMADQIFELARMQERPVTLGQAHMVQMTSRFRIGDLIGAEDYVRDGMAYFELPQFGARPGLAAQTFGNAAQIAWIMGDASEARRRDRRALEICTRNENPYDLAFAQFMSAMLLVMMSDDEAAEDFARRSIALSDEHDFPQFAPVARIALGRALAGLGHVEEGIALIHEGIRGREEARSRSGASVFLTWLAEAHRLAGALDEAVDTADEALRANSQELFFRPETLRLRGDLHRERGEAGKAERDYLEALASARTMRATLFYARASESLERLAGS